MKHARTRHLPRWSLLGGALISLGLAGFTSAPRRVQAADPPSPVPLAAQDVRDLIRGVAVRVRGDRLTVAVVDRRGNLLGLWHRAGGSPELDEVALGVARTGAFFGSDGSPLTSRTVRFISGLHFPPRVKNQPAGQLYGIENTNRVDRVVNWNSPATAFPPPLNVANNGPSLGLQTGKKDVFDSDERSLLPSGIPVYTPDLRNPTLNPNGPLPHAVGGIGVVGIDPLLAEAAAFQSIINPPRARGLPEYTSFQLFLGNRAIFADGIRLPLVVKQRLPDNTPPGSFTDGTFRVGPQDGELAPEGLLAGPCSSPELSADEVMRIVNQSVRTASRTRAAIRLPLDARTRMVIAVGDLQNNILAVFRMPDSTVFSVDVAVAKARNVVYFSGPNRQPSELPGLPVGTAITNRTLNFSSQPLYPSGIDNTRPGPFFELFRFDFENPGTQGMQPPNGKQNGIVFFPGSVPLYKQGRLVGGLGISGDGVDQDDFVAYGGSRGFRVPARIRADQFHIRGARQAFLKFPRNPTK